MLSIVNLPTLNCYGRQTVDLPPLIPRCIGGKYPIAGSPPCQEGVRGGEKDLYIHRSSKLENSLLGTELDTVFHKSYFLAK